MRAPPPTSLPPLPLPNRPLVALHPATPPPVQLPVRCPWSCRCGRCGGCSARPGAAAWSSSLAELQKYSYNQTRAVSELWLGPFMRRLADELPDYERRSLLNSLRDAGAIRIGKRPGEPHPFPVIVANYQRPDVWELNPKEEQ